jgi:hypothetical protein
VHDVGAVVECAVDVAVTDSAMVVEVAWVAATADPTAVTVGDAGDLLDVDMDQLSGRSRS